MPTDRVLTCSYTDPERPRPGAGLTLWDSTAEPWRELSQLGLPDPSYAWISRGLGYIVGESTHELFTVEIDDALVLLDRQPLPAPGPVHVDGDGSHLVVSSYTSGALLLYSLADPRRPALVGRWDAIGSGPHERQSQPHLHMALFLPDGRIASADLGSDRIRLHRPTDLDVVDEVALPAGSGPRHLSADPAGTLTVVTELTNEVYTLEVSGGLAIAERASLADTRPSAGAADPPQGFRTQGWPSHVLSTPRPTVAVRGPDIVRVGDEVSGTGGAWPRHVTWLGNDLVIANERSGTITALHSGVGSARIVAEVGSPAWIGGITSDAPSSDAANGSIPEEPASWPERA